MNAKESKQVPIRDILAYHGHHPVKETKGQTELWYLSPFVDEKNPSMHVHTRKNIYKDFSAGQGFGGDALHLVTKLQQVDIKQALSWMREFALQISVSPVQRPVTSSKPASSSGNPLVLEQAGSMTNPSLLRYVTEQRKISPTVAADHLQQVHYRHSKTGKHYYGVGMSNVNGGYDVRSPLPDSKMVIGSSGISVLKGTHRDQKIDVFESRWDFLTKATMTGGRYRDTVIVNSANHVADAVEHLTKQPHSKLVVYGHHDMKKQGERFLDALQQTGKAVVDRSSLYRHYKDLNEAYQATGKNLFTNQQQNMDYQQALQDRLARTTKAESPSEAYTVKAQRRLKP